jgi:hypothetical protein
VHVALPADRCGHEYRFTRGGRAVATGSKQRFSWTDRYGVDIAGGEDDILMLASSVVIDRACHGNQKDRECDTAACANSARKCERS